MQPLHFAFCEFDIRVIRIIRDIRVVRVIRVFRVFRSRFNIRVHNGYYNYL